MKPITYIPNSIKNTVVVCLLPNIGWSIVQRKRICCLSVYLNNYCISGRGVAISHRGIERISPHDSLLEYWSPIVLGVFGVANASAARISHCFYVHHLPGHLWIILTDIDMGRAARIVAALQPGCEEMEREWGNEEEMEIEWGNKEEMERKWGNGERFTLYISSFSPYFLPLYPFPISKFVTFCPKMLNTAFLSRMSQKT